MYTLYTHVADSKTSEWNMTEDHVNHSQVKNLFILRLFIVALAAYFGRFPVLFWFVVVAVGTAVWCAAAQSFESFMVLHPFFTF